MTDKKLGGYRPGSGRKPDPNKMVNIQAKVPPGLKMFLIELVEYPDYKRYSVSSLIAEILGTWAEHHGYPGMKEN